MMKYALITGASRGIGKGIALALADAGYNLILTCHKNKSVLDKVAALASQSNVRVLTYTCDLSSPKDCEELFSYIKKQNAEPDVLINNAGISYVGLLQDMTYKEWHDCIDTNLSSVFYMCKLAIPHMLKKKSGRIINISSVWGNIGASLEVAYSASKGGINSFTKALAKELAPSNIQVNAIACGIIDTDMNKHLTKDDIDCIIDEIPANRLGTIDEAGKMVLSILSAPCYMTGQIITMDGGWT